MDKSESPQAIAVIKEPPGLELEWSDGFKRKLSFIVLRKECPCAACRGEPTPLDPNPNVLPTVGQLSPEAGICKNMFKIGGYAIGFRWGDGHDTGIYSFEYLRALAEGVGK